MIERWFESLKYERLYRHDITHGLVLGEHVVDFVDESNRLRPHEAIDWQRPLERYLQDPEPSSPTDPEPRTPCTVVTGWRARLAEIVA